MIYLEFDLERMKALLKTRPRLQGKVLLPLDVRCDATIEDVVGLVDRLKKEYEAFESYDDDIAMRGFLYSELRKLSELADQNMSDRMIKYLSETVNVAGQIENEKGLMQCRLFSIALRNLLIIYSNYNKNTNYFDLKSRAITYKSVYELCAIQIGGIYQRDKYDYGCDMHNPNELASWTINNGLPIRFPYTVDDPAYKGIDKLLNGYPKIQKYTEIEASDCNIVQFFYCSVLTGLNTMLEGSRNG